MKLAIDIPAETYKAISEWDEPKTKYAAEYMLYQFVKNGKRIEQTNCSDAISRQTAKDLGAECIAKRDENGNLIPLGSIDSLPSVRTEKICRWAGIQHFEDIANGKFKEQFTCVAITDGNETRHICVVNCSRFCVNPRYKCEKNKNACQNCGARMEVAE